LGKITKKMVVKSQPSSNKEKISNIKNKAIDKDSDDEK